MANVPCLQAGVCLASGLFALLAAAPIASGDEPRLASAAAGAFFQDPPGADAAANAHPYIPHGPGRRFVGLSAGMLSCEVCHNVRSEGQPIPGVGGQVAGSWVLANEVGTWGLLDKHYQAYTVLLKERSQQMARILGVVDAQGNSQIHRDVRCLTCHSGLPLDQMGDIEDGLVSAELTQDRRLNLGVSCEGCHGAAGQPGAADGWLLAHINPQTWRYLSPEEKWQKHGYYDVRSTIPRTKMCASCHIGNARAGRVVTHEMYAAGHPPLPGFEVETFIDQEPPHWRELKMKPEQVRNEFLMKTEMPFNPDELHRTQKVLAGSLVSLSEYLKLTADLADSSVEMPVAKPEWPELAQFACYACHHELQMPSWRQERGYWLVPGRPVPHEWPFALARIAENTTERRAVLDQELPKLAEPLNRQPFGTSRGLPSAARAVAAWAESAAERVDSRALLPEDGQALLKRLAEVASRETLDYDSARQLVWAFAVIYRELHHGGYVTPFDPSAAEIGWFPEREGLDPVEQKLAELDELLLLDLRKGRKTTATLPGATPDQTEERPLLEVDLEAVLAPIDRYKPSEFQARFREIAGLLE